jgi:hypothetical protein
MGRCAVEPGRHTNWGHVFVAHGARRVARPTLDAAEDLAVRLVPAADLVRLVEAERIVHGVHVAAVMGAAVRGLLPPG